MEDSMEKLMKEKLLSPTNATVLGNKISQIENQLAIIQILDCQDLQQIANLIYTDRENHTIDIFSSMQDNLSGMSKEVKCFLLYTFPYKYTAIILWKCIGHLSKTKCKFVRNDEDGKCESDVFFWYQRRGNDAGSKS